MRPARCSPRPARMESQRAGSPEPGAPRPSDAEIRAIAAQLAGEHGRLPPASPGSQLSAQAHELAPADEERVEAAVVALVAGDPEGTMRAGREATGEPAPRPKWWARDGAPPERAEEA